MAAEQQQQQGAAPPAPPAAAAAQPTVPTASQQLYAEQVRRSMDQLRALFAQLDAAGGSGDPPTGFFEPCRGQPGVRLDPVTWDELSALVADGSEQALGTLGRTPLQIKEYWDYRDTVVLMRFASVTDYLRQKVFGLPTAPGPDGRLVAQVPQGFFWSNGGSSACNGSSSSSSSGGGSEQASSSSSCPEAGSSGSSGQNSGAHQLVTVWRDNDFPYHLAAGITHFNLWANRPLSQRQIEQHIEQHVPPGADTLWFVNPPVLQSVPSIWHAHILVRQPAEGAASAGNEERRPAAQPCGRLQH
ncbi:hypothetical protein C2E21_8875 [Chlorella sorokiniana]|uniref:Uncharacterized protein n=1 Tax=Chlorella sorokiniana TaxID=3076 RepID=A0A2P6TDR4_CHLSO|nr:hypothetical protein C2E21_8875 [Chlorella sorokiniana]|eukprot:PRW20771.1 hypothetical protein C2E21_8875 [Chlorella sorokiniana]